VGYITHIQEILFFTVFFSPERFVCYNSYQCLASSTSSEGVRFLSVGGFIIATGGAVGNRVDKFVAAWRSLLVSGRMLYQEPKTNLLFCDLCHHERYRFDNCCSISFATVTVSNLFIFETSFARQR